MKEYMLHIWGGAWNKDSDPSILKDYNINEGYHYFQNKEDRDNFVSILRNPIYSRQGLMIDEKYGEMSHKRTIFVYQLKYKDKTYDLEYDFGYEFEEDRAIFMFVDGNYSCDCNKSTFIQEKYGEFEVDELECGDEIELVDYHFDYRD